MRRESEVVRRKYIFCFKSIFGCGVGVMTTPYRPILRGFYVITDPSINLQYFKTYLIQYINVQSILALTVLIGEFAGDVVRIRRHPYCYCFNLKI